MPALRPLSPGKEDAEEMATGKCDEYMKSCSERFYVKYLGTIISCGVMLLLTVPRHSGFVLGIFIMGLVPYFLYSGVRVYWYRNELSTRATQLAIWVSAITFAVGVNYYRYTATRSEANDVVAKIEQFHAMHNAYPSSLEDIGYGRSALRKSLGLHAYSNEKGKPSFFYGVPYIIYDTYQYDFNSRQWVYRAD